MYIIFFRANEVIFINPYDKLFFKNNYKIFGNSHLIPTEGTPIADEERIATTRVKRSNGINSKKPSRPISRKCMSPT